MGRHSTCSRGENVIDFVVNSGLPCCEVVNKLLSVWQLLAQLPPSNTVRPIVTLDDKPGYKACASDVITLRFMFFFLCISNPQLSEILERTRNGS